FLSEVFHALADGPAWARTVFIVTYDEWGGFYDHVAPGRATPGIPAGADPATGVDQDLVDGRTLLGFRVPCIVASPFSRSPTPAPTAAATRTSGPSWPPRPAGPAGPSAETTAPEAGARPGQTG